MSLIQEYKNQNNWRDWERYITRLPLSKNQTIYDLGCSIGTVSQLLSKKVKKVIGFDNNEYLLEEANREKEDNCKFFLEDISTFNSNTLEMCDGIWMSFTLAYIKNPDLFISNWIKRLNPGGWFAIVDINRLFSSHLPKNHKYYNEIKAFEVASEKSNLYDFRVGGKIKDIMVSNGLEVVFSDENCYDRELNFKGKAKEDVLKNWSYRLNRMIILKEYLGKNYEEFSNEFLNVLSNEDHMSTKGVQYYIGIKV